MTYKSYLILICIAIGGVFLASCASGTGDTTEEEPIPPEEEVSAPAQTVGINVNGQYNLMKYENINRTGTTWVRGFIDIFQLYPDETNLEEDPRIQKFLRLKDEGYKTILSIKWNFHGKSFPEIGSDEMESYKSYLNKFLQKVWNRTDIIVSGNEPFIESKRDERGDQLVAFYEEITREIHEFSKNSSRDVPIYVGAFNNLYLDGWRTSSVNDLLSFARSNAWIAGVDLHIHHAAIEQISDALDWVYYRVRSNQKILITEYSLMKHWRSKMRENIPDEFASKYEWDPSTQNYSYIDHALKNQVPHQEWVDFLSNSYWYENRKNYLWNSYQRFKAYDKFHVANYALRQSFPFNRDFTDNIDPWILNGIFANRTVEKDSDTGRDQFNYAWIDDFTKIQNDSNQ